MIPVGLLLVGGSGLALAAVGLLANAMFLAVSLTGRLVPPEDRRQFPYFYLAYALMWSVSTALQLALGVVSVRLCQGESAWAWALASWTAALLCYGLSVRTLARRSPRPVARSISAATGVANAGLGFHVLTAFPIWGTLLAMLLHRAS
jgi:hypothetical protein